ncbi:Uma2 family endonuclease [Phormidesmis priestleyi ULC007]|uniref:Uma2 family endonuclease n=1 Tax=Phormidesmis priestleyi ULC007 TaxID=1920490 RepID=A0A2T1DP23_9CYAN|nr:Uma2 family endonuclease [Phormidesmis priestleyi]PSB22250.1 Uma2 family endonuclease [Phormidesmis priestleyi ULC007]PZO46771.1 MAG: Uma2 family endonuclease [Phormidesmis priestleyi]
MVTIPKQMLSVPPLENGDRLSRHEFERRYQAMPQVKKAELIEGVAYMASPLRIKSHGEPHGNIIGWLWTYKTAKPGVVLGDNPTVRLDPDNEPQPDAVLFIPGRQATISADDYIEGAPELVAEVAASTVSIDLHDKKRAYRRSGVQEYIVWRTLDQQLDWFVLKDDEYVLLNADERGIIRSRVFPGLWLAVSALLKGDMKTVLSVLQTGLQSSEG